MKLSSSLGILLLCVTASLLAQTNDPSIAPMARPNAVPEGTTFLVRLQDKLEASELHQGEHFTARLDEDLVSADGNMIPRGKRVRGHVSSVEFGLHTRLLLSFDEIQTNHGWVALIATITGVPGEHGVKTPDSEGEIENRGVSAKQTMEDVAVGAARGSGVGGSEGGANGAGGGRVAGAATGAIQSLLASRDLRLEKGTTLEVRLDRPLLIPSH